MSKKERWASRFGLVLAMAGNAVGLGNFLRFPAQAAKNGGGAFLIPYFVALLLLGLPLIWVEWAMGRYGGQHGHHSTPGIFQSHSRNPFWKYFGVMGLWTCLIIASYYLYIESWTIIYAIKSIIGGFQGLSPSDVETFFADMTGQTENSLIAISPWGMAVFAGCVLINIYILSRGLARGIELVSKVGMPLLIFFAAILAVRGLIITPENDPQAKTSAIEGLSFVWQPRYTSLADPSVWLAAAGQIFFTISIGMGSMHCYASYLRESDDVALTSATAGWTNEFCEVILGGSILIPIAVAYLGLPEVVNKTSGGSGFGLGFLVFPTLFNNWGWFGPVAGLLWFGLLFFAAITSSLAMGQPILAFFQQEYNMSRERSAVAFGMLLLPLALCVAMTHSSAFFDEFDFWAGTFMLVVFAMGESILFPWIFGMTRGWTQIIRGADIQVPGIFRFIIKYITPLFLAIILVSFVFLPSAGWNAYIEAAISGKPMPTWDWSGDGMIGKILHRDIDSMREKKFAEIDEQLSELRATTAERSERLSKLRAEIAAVEADTTLQEYERGAKRISMEAVIERLNKVEQMTPEQRQEKIDSLTAQREQADTFTTRLPWVRNFDRLVMIGVYAFFCVLVYRAFRKHKSRDIDHEPEGVPA